MIKGMTTLAAVIIAAVTHAEEQVDALIPCSENLHVLDTRPSPNSDLTFEDPSPEVKLAPLFPHKLDALGLGRIFNLASFLPEFGISLEPHELVLYSPQSRLMFCRARAGVVDIARALFETHDHGVLSYRFTLLEGVAEAPELKGEPTPRNRRLVLRGDTVSGARFEIAQKEGKAFSLEFVANYEKQVTVTADGVVPLGGDEVKISSRSVTTNDGDILLFERPSKSDPDLVDRLLLRLEPMPNADQQRYDGAWQKKRISEIARELSRLVEQDAAPNR